jgi:hypothetical protein
MPSHIYVLLGMYREAAEANIAAWEVDEVYVKKEGIFNFYTGYRVHNMHFISYAAMFAGLSQRLQRLFLLVATCIKRCRVDILHFSRVCLTSFACKASTQ